jgi:hypothetical protein
VLNLKKKIQFFKQAAVVEKQKVAIVFFLFLFFVDFTNSTIFVKKKI